MWGAQEKEQSWTPLLFFAFEHSGCLTDVKEGLYGAAPPLEGRKLW